MSICDATRTERLEMFCCNCSCHRILTVPAGKPVKIYKKYTKTSREKQKSSATWSRSSLQKQGVVAHSPTGKVKEKAAPGFTLAGFSRCFSWRHFKPTKVIASDDHLRRHQDRKIGNFLLQLLVPSDLNGSGRKTCKTDEKNCYCCCSLV